MSAKNEAKNIDWNDPASIRELKNRIWHLEFQFDEEGIEALQLIASQANSIGRLIVPYSGDYKCLEHNWDLETGAVRVKDFHLIGRRYTTGYQETSEFNTLGPMLFEAAIFSSRPFFNEVRSSLLYRGKLIERSMKVLPITDSKKILNFWRQSRFLLLPHFDLDRSHRGVLCSDSYGVGVPIVMDNYRF